MRRLLLVCSILLLVHWSEGGCATTATVSSAAGLIDAFLTQSVDCITLVEDVLLDDGAWPLLAVQIQRNLTVSSKGRKLLDFALSKHRLHLEPDVHFVLKDIVLSGTATGASLNLFATSPGAFVVIKNAAVFQAVCPDLRRLIHLLRTHPRPSGLAGFQQVSVRKLPVCQGQKCYMDALQVTDFASDQHVISLARTAGVIMGPNGTYSTRMLDTVTTCRRAFTTQCINTHGYGPCREEAYHAYLRGEEDGISWRIFILMYLPGAVLTALAGLAMLWGLKRWCSVPAAQPATTLVDIMLESPLRAESSGVVYKAVWQHRDVEVKVLRYEAEDSGQVVQELATSMSVDHPNLVRTLTTYPLETFDERTEDLDVPSYSNVPPPWCTSWIVRELCDLGSLTARLRQTGGPLEQAQVLKYAYGIACGMAHLHRQGICHGDLHPDNVLLMSDSSDEDGVAVKVGGFGLSRRLDGNKSWTRTNTYGTVSHMAPELFKDGVLRRECDVYSFGCILWNMVTGQELYADLNAPQVVCKVVGGGRPPIPSQTCLDMVHLMEECWAQDDLARPTFVELVERLKGKMVRCEQHLRAQQNPQPPRPRQWPADWFKEDGGLPGGGGVTSGSSGESNPR